VWKASLEGSEIITQEIITVYSSTVQYSLYLSATGPGLQFTGYSLYSLQVIQFPVSGRYFFSESDNFHDLSSIPLSTYCSMQYQ
jgi:hypothetical protein